MSWLSMSSKDASDHKSKKAVNQETYLNEYLDKRLLFQIFIRMEIISFGQSTLFRLLFDWKKISHVFLVLTIHQMFLQLVQLRL